MNEKAKPQSKLTGMTNFADDEADYLPPPSREIREEAKAGGASIGFVSDKPPSADTAPPIAPAADSVKKKRARLPSQYPDHYNLRLREGDRERFDEYAYRHRMMKGEVFAIMLDLLEAKERAERADE